MSRRPLAPFALVLAVAVVALTAPPGLAASALAAPRSGQGARVRATLPQSELGLPHGAVSGPSVRVNMPPVGLSIEYPLMEQYLGTGPCPPPALVGELIKLGSPPIRLGGDSQDFTVPPGAITGPPSSWEAAVQYELPADFWAQMHCLLTATKEAITVGINARLGELAWAEQMVQGAQSAETNGVNFSIGNEPDLYRLPEYLSSADQPADEAGAVTQYLRVAIPLRQAMGDVHLLGPDLATATHWRSELPRVLDAMHESVLGVHLYPLSECDDPAIVTVPTLLSQAVAEAPRRFAWVVAVAAAAHIPAIISESNSVSCGGKAGVSDTPAAAVWAVRFVLNALKSGFQEVRFHSSGRYYDPFIVRDGEVIERPLATALAALNRWLPIGSTLRTVTGIRRLLTTAVSGGGGSPRFIFDNERPSAQKVVLGSLHSVTVQILSPTRAGLVTAVLPAIHGRVKLVVAPNDLVAVM